MEPIDNDRVVLLSHDEFLLRINKIRAAMATVGIKAVLLSDNANIYYVTGRVFDGLVYIPAAGETIFFIRRPVVLKGDGVVFIRKPEDMAQTIGLNVPENIGMELDLQNHASQSNLP